jgi:tetratricopeptide (TPR) repeat protein
MSVSFVRHPDKDKERSQMYLQFLLLSSLLMGSPLALAQLPPLGAPQQQEPSAQSPPPPVAPGASVPGTLSADAANADLKLARAANAEKRFADAEKLMRKDTALKPNMLQLWVELGTAQLGLKKYEEAEVSFKAALTSGEAAQKQPPAGGFYNEGKGTVAHVSVTTSTPAPLKKDSAEIQGAAYAGLGEVYIHLGKTPQAKDSFDKAVATFPAQAPLYLRNETILFLQTGNAVEQVNAANKAIAVDPTRAVLYFYKGQGLAAQATVDSQTNKLVLPPGCAEALQKYLDLDPNGSYSAEAKGMLTAAGVPLKPARK